MPWKCFNIENPTPDRLEAAIEQGLSRDAAREQYRWDECARDHCPMVPRTYNGGGFGYGA